jgi:formamidopyrimidine-DNA glycosylase
LRVTIGSASLPPMPELPDVEAYLAALRSRVLGEPLTQVRLRSFSLLRTFDPPLEAVHGRQLVELRRLGKRLALGFEGDLWLVLHLMIAGRLRWRDAGAKIPGRIGLAAFDWPDGTVVLTEAGTKKRASLHVVDGAEGLVEHDRGGAEPLGLPLEEFTQVVTSQNRTLKRALTDQHLLSGIGNAFSDEILHTARLSPVRRTQQLDDDELARLHGAVQEVLGTWRDRLVAEAEEAFPEEVTAFRPEFAVHGRFEEPCPVCGHPVQRIRYASNETNYCASCQTEGRILADRSLSRLLKDDWPATLEELEAD